MSSPKPWYVLLVLCCVASAPPAFAQGTSAPAQPAQAAGEDEVQQLRREIAELRAELRKLQASQAKAGTAAPPPAPPPPPPAAPPTENAASQAQVDSLQQQVRALQAKANQPPPPPPPPAPATAGWNGEHFFLRSTDGNFVLMPIGYLIGQYSIYGNSYGAPPDSFAIRTARFGFEGSYGRQLDYVFTMEGTASPIVRDAYLDVKPASWLRFMGGQFKVPFAMEVGTADTAVEFYNRSIVSMLYPDAAGANRAPGIDAHGEFVAGAIEYWAGIFNGQGVLNSGTTNEPEIVARVRFSPFKTSENAWLRGIGFGGSYEHSRSKGLAGEQSFNSTLNDNTYTFFPQFHINGNVNRYNGFASWLVGPLALRGEYAHLQQDRTDVGSLNSGGIAFLSQPAVVGEGYYVSAVYFLTGETAPYNAQPRVKNPVIGPGSPGESGAPGWGAWSLKFRYSHVSANAPGSACDATTDPACPITPVIEPGFNYSTDQFTFGFNWYLNYWVVLKTDVNLDRLKDPSVQGILPHNYWVYIESLQFRF